MEPHSPEQLPPPRGITFFDEHDTITPHIDEFNCSRFSSAPTRVMDIGDLELRGYRPESIEGKEDSVLGREEGDNDARIITATGITIEDALSAGLSERYRLSVILPEYTGEKPIGVSFTHPGDGYRYESNMRSLVYDEVEDEETGEDIAYIHGTTETWNVIDPKTNEVIQEHVDIYADADALALSHLHFSFSQ